MFGVLKSLGQISCGTFLLELYCYPYSAPDPSSPEVRGEQKYVVLKQRAVVSGKILLKREFYVTDVRLKT